MRTVLDRRRDDAAIARKVAKIALEVGEPLRADAPGRTAAGDARRLRGIPAIGYGVGGAIAGTRPGENLERKLSNG